MSARACAARGTGRADDARVRLRAVDMVRGVVSGRGGFAGRVVSRAAAGVLPMQYYPPQNGMQVGGAFLREKINKKDVNVKPTSGSEIVGNTCLLPDYREEDDNKIKKWDVCASWLRRFILGGFHVAAWVVVLGLTASLRWEGDYGPKEIKSATTLDASSTNGTVAAADTTISIPCLGDGKSLIEQMLIAIFSCICILLALVVIHSICRYKYYLVPEQKRWFSVQNLWSTNDNPFAWVWDVILLGLGLFSVLGCTIVYMTVITGRYSCGDVDPYVLARSFCAFLFSLFGFAQLLTYWSVWLKTDA